MQNIIERFLKNPFFFSRKPTFQKYNDRIRKFKGSKILMISITGVFLTLFHTLYQRHAPQNQLRITPQQIAKQKELLITK